MLQEAEISVLLQENEMEQEEQLPDLATDVLLVSGRKKTPAKS